MVTRRLSNLLMQHSQNVTILHRLVQSLGTMRDSAELRQQFHLQTEVVHELAGKIQGDLQAQAAELDNVSRQEAARRRATYTKLSKDFHRVNSIAAELETEAGRRSGEWDRKKEQEAATMQQQEAAMFGGGGMTGGGGQGQHQQQQMMINMQEEAVNQAIIEETEEELRNINRSLYKVNEVYRDLASIVSQQDEQVHHIEAKTEAAHERARQGLQQVQKANQSQSSCVLS